MAAISPPAYDGPRPDPYRPGYVSRAQAIRIAATPEQVLAWNAEQSLEDAVDFESRFPAVVETEPLRGDWVPGDRVGDRRRVRFSDGSFLAEEVLIDTPETFRYLIWGFTARLRFAVRQGRAEFRHLPDQCGTRVEWTYALLPTTPVLRPVVGQFLHRVMTPMMTTTLSGMRDGVEAALTATD